MTTGSGLTSGKRDSTAVRWQEISNLLASGDYSEAVRLLHVAQRASIEAGDTAFADILEALCRICWACGRHQADVEWHRQAALEKRKRELELRQQIQSLVNAARNYESTVGEDEGAAAFTVRVEIEHEDSALQRRSIWDRIRAFFGWEPEAAEAPAHEPPPVEEIEPAPTPTVEVALPTAEEEPASSPPAEKIAEADVLDRASLVVYGFGPFRIYQDDQPIDDWPSLKGQAIFKYLITHRQRPVDKEVLMDLFWPDADPNSARNNLNVAIYGLRQAFREVRPDTSYILFQDDSYLLNPEVHVWFDVEEFAERFNKAKELEQHGDLALAISEYRAAEVLYQGEFFEEDRYEEWLLPIRRRLRDDYLNILDRLSRYYLDRENYGTCITMCSKMLAVDSCREEAHRRLMCCYSRQGQRYLALRQYHRCEEALAQELNANPSQRTVELYEKVHQGERV